MVSRNVARNSSWLGVLAVGASLGAVSAAVQKSRHREVDQGDSVGRKNELWWVPPIFPSLGVSKLKQSACEGASPSQLASAQHTRMSTGFGGVIKNEPKDHPWIATSPAAPSSLLPEERIITFLVANAAAGKVEDVKRDWSFLPSHMHAAGMEALLQNHLLVGFPRTINAIAAVHQVGVEGSDWKEEPRAGPEFWRNRGEEALEAVYGAKYQRLRNRMESLHPVLNSIMVGLTPSARNTVSRQPHSFSYAAAAKKKNTG
mmetsp:Transcript_22113/g.45085  ORF Transcript_22113/g.45085 Transcript_22113/m.45085 type:complete len:259 (+) Transcript_22113:33-809(+)